MRGLGIGLFGCSSKAVFFTLGFGVGRCKGILLGLGIGRPNPYKGVPLGLESLWKPQRPFTLALNVHSNPFRFVAEHFITIIRHKICCLIGVARQNRAVSFVYSKNKLLNKTFLPSKNR